MSTLFDEMLKLARTVSVVREGTATGGSKTTVDDINIKYTTNEFPGGTVFFLSGANLGASRRITAYTGNTFTFAPMVTSAVVAGVRFAVADRDFPRDILAQAVNSAIRQQYPLPYKTHLVGVIPLVTVADQEEYTINAMKVVRVEIATSLTAPYGYQISRHWRQNGATLEFDKGYAPSTAGYRIRITYLQDYTELTTDAGVVDQAVDLNLLHWQAVVELNRIGLILFGGDSNRQLTNILNEAYAQVNRIPKPPRPNPDTHHANW